MARCPCPVCRGAGACATAAATETQAASTASAFPKLPGLRLGAGGERRPPGAGSPLFPAIKGPLGSCSPWFQLWWGFSPCSSHPESLGAPSASLCFFFGNLSCFEQGSGAEGVCTFRASPPHPELVPSQTRGRRVPINPSPLNFALPAPGSEGRRLNITRYLWGRRRGPAPFLHHFFFSVSTPQNTFFLLWGGRATGFAQRRAKTSLSLPFPRY